MNQLLGNWRDRLLSFQVQIYYKKDQNHVLYPTRCDNNRYPSCHSKSSNRCGSFNEIENVPKTLQQVQTPLQSLQEKQQDLHSWVRQKLLKDTKKANSEITQSTAMMLEKVQVKINHEES